jgi:putative transposase
VLARLDRFVGVRGETPVAGGELELLDAEVVEKTFVVAPLTKDRRHLGRGIETLFGTHGNDSTIGVGHWVMTFAVADMRCGRATLIWYSSPSIRRDVCTDAMLVRCREVMSEICDDFGCELVAFNGETDHVHLLVEFPPTVQLSKLVNSLKGVSARLLRKDFDAHVRQYLWGGHFWVRSYYVGTAGGAPLSTIAEYIHSQERPSA